MKKKKAAVKRPSQARRVKKTVSKKRPPARVGKKAGKAKKTNKKQVTSKPAPKLGKLIGEVTHYFPHVNAAVVKVGSSGMKLGDQLHFKGHTTDFKQKADSIQIDRKPITRAQPDEEIGIEVKKRVRPGDKVYLAK